MFGLIARFVGAFVLAGSAALKLASPGSSRAALATFEVEGERMRWIGWAVLVATELGEWVEAIDRFAGPGDASLALAVFTSEGCRVCRGLEPAIAALAGDPAVAIQAFDEVADRDVWSELRIPGSPFAIALDPNGIVLAKGTFNNLAQLESVLATAERRRSALLTARGGS